MGFASNWWQTPTTVVFQTRATGYWSTALPSNFSNGWVASTVDWGWPYKPPAPKNWRWFDVFREFEPYRLLDSVSDLAARLWRRQERLDRVQRRRCKRRRLVQLLRAT
jgi:hypothetical protein